ncbi:hypothetical protein SS50377_28232 [Spironucleus salmonicida]|uniref:Uncharacterized protein n=1 Tax=Spironucleus salmonicida TaxID=348837 RepID=V6M4X9_9EUKA|nr:hypothetical protein SS50377_28232 [Spironucleus salmonicida]|eukprot:EST48414.1 Hypothetical protein SS50377_11362 [Spironucleus salmonicida]
MIKSKLTAQEIEMYLLSLRNYFQKQHSLSYLPTDTEAYKLYRSSPSKRLWGDIAQMTNIDRTKVYKHYSFTYTRKFHPDISGEIQNSLNLLIENNGNITQFEKQNDLHHDVLDQYIRYYKRKHNKSRTPQNSPVQLALKNCKSEEMRALILAVYQMEEPALQQLLLE